jgi:hypothetical protein
MKPAGIKEYLQEMSIAEKAALIAAVLPENHFSHRLPAKDKARIVSAACYYLTVAGLTQKETRRLLGLGEKTMLKWVRVFGWDAKIKELQANMRKDPMKFDDSLSAFKAYTRIRHPDLYRNFLPVYNQYLNTL